MSRRVLGACLLVIVGGGAMPAFAQTTHKLGVVMGYPTAAGVLWHVGDRIALRPDFSVTRQQVETTTTAMFVNTTETFTSSTDTWNTSLGLSALFYLGPQEDLRCYVSPRLAWVWTRGSSENSLGSSGLTPRDVDTDGYLVSGAFGAQYSVSDRFRVFGELGVTYSKQDDDTELSGSRFTTSLTGFGLRSGVGIVVYF